MASSGPISCPFTSHSLSRLTAFSTATGREPRCGSVFSDTAPDWWSWTHPWFISTEDPDQQWARWTSESEGRRLVISPGLVPLDAPADWRERGARGEYDDRYRELGRNLVDAGLGDSVIRLAHEGNGEWFPHWFGANASSQAAWKETWRRAASSLRSTAGARFTLDWNVAAGYDDVPLDWYYPGDDVVDVIGFDIYDLGWMAPGNSMIGAARWVRQCNRVNGPRTVVDFAVAHAKRVSVPEWGLVTAGGAEEGGGDNPFFVNGLRDLVKGVGLLYEGYFEDSFEGRRVLLLASPAARAAYMRATWN